MKPIMKYYGGKWRTARHYPAPRYQIVIEPFAGGAGYSLYYEPKSCVLNDANMLVAQIWDTVLRVPDLIHDLPDVVNGYSPAENLARANYGLWHGQKPLPRPTSLSSWPRKRAELWQQGLELARKDWSAICTDYRDLADVEATWFIDPPYQGNTAASSAYRGDIDYAELAEWCKTRRGQIIVCEQEGADWLPFRPLGANTSTCRSRRGKKEMIWTSD
jgi:site-specific DNA-adenine methylase